MINHPFHEWFINGPFNQRGLAAGRPEARAAGGLRHGLRKSGVARGGAPGRNGTGRWQRWQRRQREEKKRKLGKMVEELGKHGETW